MTIKATLDKRPKPGKEMPEYEEKNLEFTVRELSFADRVFMSIDDGENGLLIENIESAGWAALAGLRQGDLLLKIDHHSVNQIEEIQSLMADLIKKQPKQVVFFVKRGIHTLFIELQPEWEAL